MISIMHPAMSLFSCRSGHESAPTPSRNNRALRLLPGPPAGGSWKDAIIEFSNRRAPEYSGAEQNPQVPLASEDAFAQVPGNAETAVGFFPAQAEKPVPPQLASDGE
ncbi:MAG: hypothetical protein ACREFR_09010 [Limisphaerales bacterium]